MAIAFSVAYTATPLSALTKAIIEATPQLSAGRNFVGRSQFKQILVTAAAAASPANILAAYNAKYGSLISGRKVFVRVTIISSDGQRSAPLTTSVTVA
jgi:hypothetical protein